LKSPNSLLAPVLKPARLTQDIFSLWLHAPSLARAVKPGQFLGVKTAPGLEPLLRRPISVADVQDGRLRLVFRVVGQGTELLSHTKKGDRLDVLGPLGKPAAVPQKRAQLICGGGVGAAPLLFYCRRLKNPKAARVFLGARTRKDLILVSEFRRLGVKLALATEDGSTGHKGMVTELVKNEIRNQIPETRYQKSGKRTANGKERPAVVACGPKPMLRALVDLLDPVPVWGFVEERMGCGTGICYCCALERKDGGYVRFCQEGPVVLLNEVKL